jgi:hypothetical protein
VRLNSRPLQKFIEDPLSEALIQGHLPRPGDLEVYLARSPLKPWWACRSTRFKVRSGGRAILPAAGFQPASGVGQTSV